MEPITPTGRGRGQRRREFGFTMVELMIVMAIIVILVSLAIPQYQKAIIRSIHRTTRSVAPTEAGERLLERLDTALSEVEAALDSAKDFRRPTRGRAKT